MTTKCTDQGDRRWKETVGDRTGAVLLGLPGFVVVSAAELAGEVELLVETTAVEMGCAGCGVIAEGNGRRPVTVPDLPVAGRRAVLIGSSGCGGAVSRDARWAAGRRRLRQAGHGRR